MKHITTQEFNGLTRWQVRDAVHAYYQNHIQGTSVINTEKGITIEFKKAGRVKTAKPLMSREKAAVILNLPRLLKEAEYSNFGEPKPKHVTNYKAVGFLNFNIKCVVDGVPRKFRVPVMITATGYGYVQ